MNIYIPIADVTLTDGQTYDGQIPLWATRPLMVKVTTGANEPVNITVRNSGSPVKTVTLPYQQYGIDIDLSFAAPLLKRADRNKSQGTPWFMQQELLFWVDDPVDYITIPVFHCDLTYWDTLGVDAALPQPIKPRIPGQTLDIFFPYIIHPSDALSVQVEPVTGAPSNVIFPTTYVLGDAIDITYIKKLTIKNVWGNGLDKVINYEDRLMSDAIYDTGLQCALRARWNMRNGQWFWAAFKDYFWSNKFTPIRGRGGVTEQAEITINLEYGEEWYNVYQELLVSSNVVFDLNIPGINQYQSKRFRAEVTGDTGARWSNSTKTYRQQVRFRTTELQDNYIFPQQPDQPPTPSIAFSARFNPLTIAPVYSADRWNDIYSNAAWYVESEPSWFTVISGTTLLTPDLFEQGTIGFVAGKTWDECKVPDTRLVRLKRTFETMDEVYSVISGLEGYDVQFFYLDDNDRMVGFSDRISLVGRINTSSAKRVGLQLNKTGLHEPITPADITTLNAYWGKRYHQFPAGSRDYVVSMAQENPGDARTGTLSLRSMAGAASYPITINQQKASISLSPADLQVGNTYQGGVRITTVTCNTSWDIIPEGIPSWLYLDPVIGNAGTRDIFANIQANTGAQRTAYITFRSRLNTSVTAILSVYQAGATGNISVDTPTFNVDYVTLPVTVNVTSFGAWSVSQRDTWITPSVTTGPNGTTAVTLTIGDNTSNAARTGAITFRNDITGEIAVVTVNQTGAPTSVRIEPSKVTAPKTSGTVKLVACGSKNGWAMSEKPSWVAVAPDNNEAGIEPISITYTANGTGTKRSGYLKVTENVTGEIAICIIEQEG